MAVLTGCSDDLGPDLAACTAKTMEIYRSAQVSDERTAAYLRECMIRKGWPLGSGLIQTQNAMMAARTTADKKLTASLS